MKNKFRLWLLTFAVACAFSALSFAQDAPAAPKNTAAETGSISPSADTGKTNKKEKKRVRKPRKTNKENKKGTGK